MRVNLKQSFLPRDAVDNNGILDFLYDGEAVISTGIPKTIPDDNPWEYTAGNMMEDDMFDFFADFGQGVYVSPNRGAVFAEYECCDILQNRQGVKSVTGALNNLMVDVRDAETVFVDPSPGIINAVKNVSLTEITVAYTHPEFPLAQVQKLQDYAAEDRIVVHQCDDVEKTAKTLIGRVSTSDGRTHPVYSMDLSRREERAKLREKVLYLGSLGHWCSDYPYGRGFEYNPYHPMAYKYIDNVVQETSDLITYRIFSGAPGIRRFKLFPDYYRYQVDQVAAVYKKTKLRASDLEVVLISCAYEISDLPRVPPPVVNVLSDDVRFFSSSMRIEQEGHGILKADGVVVYDVPGTDTYYSRYQRGIKQGLVMVRLHTSFIAAQGLLGAYTYMVTSRHTDPQLIRVGQGTHYLYTSDSKVTGEWYQRKGDTYAIVSDKPQLTVPTGTIYGNKCVMLVPGDQYILAREKIVAYEYTEVGEDDGWVCGDQFLTLTPRNTRKHVLYEPTEECDSCEVRFLDRMGNIKKLCCQSHKTGVVYSLDSLYYTVPFNTFKDIKFGDDIGDYFDTETQIQPIAFES
jgi:hypothetical protein